MFTYSAIKPAAIDQALIAIQPDNKIIKAGTYQAMANADEIIRQAQCQSEKITERAQQAYEEQKKLGYQKGLQEGKTELASLHCDATVKVQTFLAQVNEDLIELTMVALTRIIGDLASIDVTREVINKSLKLMASEKNITIRVAPEQADLLEQKRRAILEEHPTIEYLTVESDPSLVGQTGSILETETGVVDALIDTQLDIVKASLKKHYEL